VAFLKLNNQSIRNSRGNSTNNSTGFPKAATHIAYFDLKGILTVCLGFFVSKPSFNLNLRKKNTDFIQQKNLRKIALPQKTNFHKVKFTLNRLRIIYEREIKSLNLVFIEKPYLILLLFLGLIPAFIKVGSAALEQKQQLKAKQQNMQIDYVLSDTALVKDINGITSGKANLTKALISYQEALKLNPDSIKINAETAALYLSSGDTKSANKYIEFVQESSNKGSAFYKNCLNGYVGLQQGQYLQAFKAFAKANTLFEKENSTTLFPQEWIEDNLGASLIAMQKNGEAFNLVNSNTIGDCQVNPVIHEACMRRIANWHKTIADIEFKLSKEASSKVERKERIEKAFYHQKRQLVFLGESLKSSFNSINDNEGAFRQQLISQHKALKALLNIEYSKYNQQLHLFKENLDIYDLTKSEKRSKPV
jgi:hypothetical protein